MDLVGNFLSLIGNAIQSSWAFWVALIGIFFCIGSWLFGHSDHGRTAKVLIAAVLLLGLNRFMVWIHP